MIDGAILQSNFRHKKSALSAFFYFYFKSKTIRSSNPSNMFFNSSLLQSIYIGNKKDEDSILWDTSIQFTQEQALLSDMLNHFECDLSEEAETYDIPIKDTGQYYTVYTRCIR